MNREPKNIFVYNVDHFRKIFIPHEQVPDYYLVSIFGTVYSTLLGNYLSLYENTKGYMLVSLQNINGKRIQERVHRLVKYTFDYIPGCEDLQIDHIDGNKANNNLWNLDWVTAAENVHRADNMELRYHGTILSASDKIEIAKLIASGYNDDQIREIYPMATRMAIGEVLQRPIENGVPYDLVLKAREVRSEMVRIANRTSVSEEQMHTLCKYFENNKPPYEEQKKNMKAITPYLNQAMIYAGLDPTNKDQRGVSRRLLNKENNSIIYSQYNY